MKTVALTSDTHGYLPRVPAGVECLIHAGDIGIDHNPINWFRDVFYPWAREARVPIYATFGNHDRIGERHALPEGKPDNLHFIVDELCMIDDVPVWFSPWSLRFYDWAFMASESTLAKKYLLIPNETQVIVSHGPPFGAGDETRTGRVGSTSLEARIFELSDLRLVVTGHIHEAYGVHDCHGVPVHNVSYVNPFYQPTHKPTVIEWPPPART